MGNLIYFQTDAVQNGVMPTHTWVFVRTQNMLTKKID